MLFRGYVFIICEIVFIRCPILPYTILCLMVDVNWDCKGAQKLKVVFNCSPKPLNVKSSLSCPETELVKSLFLHCRLDVVREDR